MLAQEPIDHGRKSSYDGTNADDSGRNDGRCPRVGLLILLGTILQGEREGVVVVLTADDRAAQGTIRAGCTGSGRREVGAGRKKGSWRAAAETRVGPSSPQDLVAAARVRDEVLWQPALRPGHPDLVLKLKLK